MIDDLCPICLDPLLNIKNNVKTTYNLPECNHSYHTECIIHWFRKGNSTCPCCQEKGENIPEHSPRADIMGCDWYDTLMTKFKYIKQISKKKDTIPFLINKIENIEKKDKTMRNELKVLSNSEGVFIEIHKRILKLQAKLSYNRRVSFQLKKEVVLIYPAKPLIIVTRKVIE